MSFLQSTEQNGITPSFFNEETKLETREVTSLAVVTQTVEEEGPEAIPL